MRDVALTAPDGSAAGTMALITMDNGFDHTKPTTYGPNGLLRLRDALDAIEPRVAAGELAAVGITGKPFIFGVGADLKDVGTLTSREQALAVARLGHDQLRRLGELAVPSFAFVNGAAMGGGVEVALHCTYRTISSSVPAVALPECFLGLVPGWGGTYLLPRLIGPAGALEVMVSNALNQNRMLKGAQAFALGIADVMLEPADFLEQSLRWAASVVSGATVVERHDHTADADAWATAVAGARGFVKAKLNGAAPAPARAIDLVESGRTADRDAGFAAEDDALADLIMSDEFRSGIYAFDLVQRRAKRPVGAPDKALARPVTKVGVVGAGLMASQLALLFARRLGVPVVMTDLDQSRVDKGVGYVHAEVDKLLGKRRVSPDAANRLKCAGHRLDLEGGLRRRRLRHRGRVRGDVGQAAGVRRGRGRRHARVRARHQHLVAVGHRDGLEARAPRAGRRLPLLQPGGGAAAARGRQGRAHRRRRTGDGFRRRQDAEEVVRAGEGRPGVRGEPAADPVPRRGHRLHRGRHAGRGRRPRAGPARPADVAVRPGAARRPGGRAAHRRDPARRVPGAVRRSRRTCKAIVDAGKPGFWSWDDEGRPFLDDETEALLDGRRPPRRPRSRCATARCRPWRRRSG